MQNLCYTVFAVVTAFAAVSGLPSGSGISQVGMNIYKDAQSYHAARAQRERQRFQQQTDGKVEYTVQHPRNPNPTDTGVSQAFWNRPAPVQPARSQQQSQNYYRPPQNNQQQYNFNRETRNRQNEQYNNYNGNTRHFQNTQASLPRELPVEATVQVIRNQNRLQPHHRFSSPHWLRTRETTDEMRQSLNLIDALDPSQPLRYY